MKPWLDDLAARVAAGSRFNPRSGCVEWVAGFSGNGYAEINIGSRPDRRPFHVARVVLALKQGFITPGSETLHSCDNTRCVTGDHVSEGSKFQNMQDCARKGRFRRSSLSPYHVKEIRRLKGKETHLAISRMYGVSRSMISRILSGDCWKE